MADLAIGFQAAGTLSVGPQDTGEPTSDEFNATLTIGELTLAGQPVALNQAFDVTRGQLSLAGSDFGLVIPSDARQLVTVTDVSLIGIEITLFDSLTGVVPAVGDIWWVPTTSEDGGTFTLSGDGTFSIGVPTSGEDTLKNVAYYDVSADQWHGPADVTVVDFPNILPVSPSTQLTVQGNAFLYLHTVVPLELGSLSIAGQAIFKGSLLEVDPIGALTLAGQSIDITRFALDVDPGQLTLAGIAIQLRQRIPITNVGLTLAGRTIDLFQGLRLTYDIGVLTIAGQTMRRNVSFEAMASGTLTVAGQNIDIIAGAGIPVVSLFTGSRDDQGTFNGRRYDDVLLTGTRS